jgi:hypothetical protein
MFSIGGCMKTYWKVLFNVIFVAVSFGVIGPYLISYKDDIFVISGIAYMVIVVPAVLYYFNRHFFAKQIARLTATDTVEGELK